MNQGHWEARKKANDSRLKKICDRLQRFHPEFKEWVEENKNLAREERINSSDPCSAALRRSGGDLGSQPMMTRKAPTGAQVNPLAFNDSSLQRMYKAFQSRESMSIRGVETKAFSTVDSLLPAELDPQVVAHIHEWRSGTFHRIGPSLA